LIIGFVISSSFLELRWLGVVGAAGSASRLEILSGSPPSFVLLHLQAPSSQFVSARRSVLVAVCRAQAFAKKSLLWPTFKIAST
jgi:hypothetical protein